MVHLVKNLLRIVFAKFARKKQNSSCVCYCVSAAKLYELNVDETELIYTC